MRHNEDRPPARRGFSLSLVLGCLWFTLGGCASTTAEDEVAQTAAAGAAASQSETETAQAPQVPFANPGSYPNLNVIPTPAAPQLTEAEQDETTTLLQSIREEQAQVSRSMRPQDDTAELREIGRTHVEEALSIIEEEGRVAAE